MGTQIICDHYVLNKRKTLFNYIAIKDVEAFALPKNYMFDFIFEKYPHYRVPL